MSVSFKINHLKWRSHQQHLWYIYPGFTVVDFAVNKMYISKYNGPVPWMLLCWNHHFQCWLFSMHPYLSGETSNICYFSPKNLGVEIIQFDGHRIFFRWVGWFNQPPTPPQGAANLANLVSNRWGRPGVVWRFVVGRIVVPPTKMNGWNKPPRNWWRL